MIELFARRVQCLSKGREEIVRIDRESQIDSIRRHTGRQILHCIVRFRLTRSRISNTDNKNKMNKMKSQSEFNFVID